MITFDRLTKRFPGRKVPVLDSCSLEVGKGEIVGFVGQNGAGKTTSIRIASGVALPSGGTVRVDGHDIVEQKIEASRMLGWVSENPTFEPSVRLLPLLRYLGRFHGLDRASAEKRGRELLGQFGLTPNERSRTRELSQGMRKRFAIAVSMIGDPPNLLLDEVLNGLDAQGVQVAREWIRGKRASGGSILLSSHILAEVQLLADRFAFLHQGRLVGNVRRDDLPAVQRPSILVRVENLDEGALVILARFGDVSRLSLSEVRVIQATGAPADLVAELVGKGYRVTELRTEESRVEAYYLGLLRAAS